MFDQPIQNYIIAGIILCFMIGGSITLISLTIVDEKTGVANVELSESDNLKFSAFNNSINKYNTMNNNVTNFYNLMVGKSANPGLFGWLDAIISLIWTPFNAIGSTFAIIPQVISAIVLTFLPESLLWIPITLLGIITVLIAFAIIALVFRIKV